MAEHFSRRAGRQMASQGVQKGLWRCFCMETEELLSDVSEGHRGHGQGQATMLEETWSPP